MIYKKPIAEILEFDDADVITRSHHHYCGWWVNVIFCGHRDYVLEWGDKSHKIFRTDKNSGPISDPYEND